MGFGIRIAPGVRLSASTRGLRAGIGPRAARIHVGAGRTSLSTGAGPFTLYGVGAGNRRRTRSSRASSPSRTSLAAMERQTRTQARALEVAQVAAVERHLQSIHREDFPLAKEPVIAPPSSVDVAALTRELQAESVSALPWWKFQRRREARQVASWRAPGLAAERDEAAKAEYVAAVTAAKALWARLIANDPQAVLAELEAAFADNESPAVAVDCHGSNVSIVVLFPTIDLVPERKSSVTPGGKPTLKVRSKTDRNELYVMALGSAVLATAKEAFAAAPAVQSVSMVVLRRDSTTMVSPIYTGRLARTKLDRFDWVRIDPTSELLAATDATLRRTGSTKDVQPLDLANEPELRALVSEITGALASH
jgi:hypothetical protein